MHDGCTGVGGLESDEADALIAALADHIVKHPHLSPPVAGR
jgi:hypothetical protein